MFVLILATMTVGMGGVLPFSNVSKGVRLKAAPYRKRLIYLIIGALAVCLLLVVLEMFSV